MSATNQFEDDLLKLLFTNTDLALIGDAAGLQGSAVPGVWYISLHESDPGETATDQTDSETAYTSYARVAVVRTTVGWTVLNGNVDNDSVIQFPEATGGTSTVTHFGIGTAASGAGYLAITGALTASLAISNGITPQYNTGQLDISIN